MKPIQSIAKKNTSCLNCEQDIKKGVYVVVVWIEEKDIPPAYRQDAYKSDNYASGVVCDYVCYADLKENTIGEDGFLRAFTE